jgi:hypothetical protein
MCERCKGQFTCAGDGEGAVAVGSPARPWSDYGGDSSPQAGGGAKIQIVLHPTVVPTAIVNDEQGLPDLGHDLWLPNQSTTVDPRVAALASILIVGLAGVVAVALWFWGL